MEKLDKQTCLLSIAGAIAIPLVAASHDQMQLRARFFPFMLSAK